MVVVMRLTGPSINFKTWRTFFHIKFWVLYYSIFKDRIIYVNKNWLDTRVSLTIMTMKQERQEVCLRTFRSNSNLKQVIRLSWSILYFFFGYEDRSSMNIRGCGLPTRTKLCNRRNQEPWKNSTLPGVKTERSIEYW